MAQQLLTYNLNNWGDQCCLSLAVATRHEEFVAHTCCQTLLTEIWMGAMKMGEWASLKVSLLWSQGSYSHSFMELAMLVLDGCHCICVFQEHLNGANQTLAVLEDSISLKLYQTNKNLDIKKTFPLKTQGEVFSRQWWERSPPTNVSRFRFQDPAWYVGRVCCWFSSLLRKVFLQVLRFSPLLKNQHFQIPIPAWKSVPN